MRYALSIFILSLSKTNLFKLLHFEIIRFLSCMSLNIRNDVSTIKESRICMRRVTRSILLMRHTPFCILSVFVFINSTDGYANDYRECVL